MNRKDVRAGVVYAEVSAYGRPSPVVFLEDGAATVWIEPFNNIRRGGPYIACRPSEKPHREKGWSGRSQGYATVQGPAETLEGLECAAELEAFKAGGRPSREGLRFALIFSLAKISGPYTEAAAAYEANLAAERATRERKDAEDEAYHARLQKAVAGLAAFGVKARPAGAYRERDVIGMDIEDAERLIALLREKTATAAGGET
jgi:hypothetical protein